MILETSDSIITLCLAILILPLISFFVNIFLSNKYSGGTGSVFQALAFILSAYVFYFTINNGVSAESFRWFSIPPGYDFEFGILLDNSAALLLIIVNFISLLVHLYSIEYMHEDKGISRYFAFLELFTFSMLGIVLADNLLVIFVFWELVGFSSFLLIGFWYQREAAAKASKKAFIVNRIGDAGFLIGILILWTQLGTLNIQSLHENISLSTIEEGSWVSIVSNGTEIIQSIDSMWLTIMGIALFCGAIGKSAQFPLQIWLPDAMEGPTPVSALIHAATMVAAGVYMIGRIYFLLNLDALVFIAIIGAITAFMGAVAALNQHDIKKVLAFSTISQLGFMVIGLGVGTYEAAMFHLTTHAFFKASLFLCAGAVIYSMHQAEHELHHKGQKIHFDAQDMRNMGGLRKQMPVTFIAYLISASALAGVPLFSGFLSKDAILTGAVSWAAFQSSTNPFLIIVPILAFLAAFLTAVYVGRQLLLVFFGDFRLEKLSKGIKLELIGEVPTLMKLPLILLSVLSIGFVFSLNPFDAADSWVIKLLPTPGPASPGGLSETSQELFIQYIARFHYPVLIASVIVVVVGLALAWINYAPGKRHNRESHTQPLAKTLPGKISYYNWFLNEIYQKIVVLPILNASGALSRFDKRVIDKGVEYTGIINVVLAHIIAWLDKIIVDGIVRLFAWIAGRIGQITRSFQEGSVQAYLIYTILSLIIIIAWIII